VIDEDAAVFFADWGEDALLAGEAVRVMFASPHASLPGDGVGMATSMPRALIASASVPSAASSDTADVALVLSEAATLRPGFPSSYKVTEVRPHGDPLLSTLILREA
jgi:hypothetical protein